MSNDVLRATDIAYRRAGRDILAGVSFVAHPGESVAITGPSGSGKTTLLTVLSGLEPPDRGDVQLGELRVHRAVDAAVRHRFGVVFQGYGLVSLLTAAENVELVLQAGGTTGDEARERGRVLLAAVGLEDRADHLVEELSGGEQQRVAVARALVGNPDVVLADEPTAELDAERRQLVLDLLLRAAHDGKIVVLVTHDDAVADQCDRQVHIADGRLVDDTRALAVAATPVLPDVPEWQPRSAFEAAGPPTDRKAVPPRKTAAKPRQPRRKPADPA